ncbi:hypothetical protein, partial [Methylomonas koyamae]|uniref:hypothetical protein n=1 Tax=Methylomonas koyamae TaxID=702114 RepID=UPI001E2A115C
MFVLSGVVLSTWSGLNEHVIPAWIAGIQKPWMASSWGLVSLTRRLFLMSGLGPTAEILSFVWPKESIQ